MGQIHAATRNPPRTSGPGDTSWPTTSPAVPRYHHQRWPLSIKRSSDITKSKKREFAELRTSGARWTAVIGAAAGTEVVRSSDDDSPTLGPGCTPRLRHDRAGSKR